MSLQSKIEEIKLAASRNLSGIFEAAATLQVPPTVAALNDKLLAAELEVLPRTTITLYYWYVLISILNLF